MQETAGTEEEKSKGQQGGSSPSDGALGAALHHDLPSTLVLSSTSYFSHQLVLPPPTPNFLFSAVCFHSLRTRVGKNN